MRRSCKLRQGARRLRRAGVMYLEFIDLLDNRLKKRIKFH